MRVATPIRYEWEGWGDAPVAIVAMGLALAFAGIVETLTMPAERPLLVVELLFALVVPTGLATGGYWLASRNASATLRRRTAVWVSIGIVVATCLGGWVVVQVHLEGGSIGDPLSLVTPLAAVGGATGFVAAIQASPAAIEPRDADATPDDSGAVTPDAATGTTTDSPETTAPSRSSASDPEGAEDATDRRNRTGAEAASTDADLTVADPDRAPSADGRSSPAARMTDPRSVSTTERSPVSTTTTALEAATSASASTERVLEVLADERARIVLAVCYHDRDGDRSVPELARDVAGHTDADAGEIATGLRHATLPRLAAIRAIDWDPHADRVSAPDHAVFEEGVRDATALLEPFGPGSR